jgi:hypothetical protein
LTLFSTTGFDDSAHKYVDVERLKFAPIGIELGPSDVAQNKSAPSAPSAGIRVVERRRLVPRRVDSSTPMLIASPPRQRDIDVSWQKVETEFLIRAG